MAIFGKAVFDKSAAASRVPAARDLNSSNVESVQRTAPGCDEISTQICQQLPERGDDPGTAAR